MCSGVANPPCHENIQRKPFHHSNNVALYCRRLSSRSTAISAGYRRHRQLLGAPHALTLSVAPLPVTFYSPHRRNRGSRQRNLTSYGRPSGTGTSRRSLRNAETMNWCTAASVCEWCSCRSRSVAGHLPGQRTRNATPAQQPPPPPESRLPVIELLPSKLRLKSH